MQKPTTKPAATSFTRGPKTSILHQYHLAIKHTWWPPGNAPIHFPNKQQTEFHTDNSSDSRTVQLEGAYNHPVQLPETQVSQLELNPSTLPAPVLPYYMLDDPELQAFLLSSLSSLTAYTAHPLLFQRVVSRLKTLPHNERVAEEPEPWPGLGEA